MCVVALVGVTGALALAATIGPDALEAAKYDVVRCALDSERCEVVDPALRAATADAHAVHALDLAAQADKAVLTIETTGSPQCTHVVLDDGKRIAIDLADTINIHAGQQIIPDTVGLVRQVRTSLFAVHPRFVSRIVLDLTEPAIVERSSEEGRVVVSLRTRDKATESGGDTASAVRTLHSELAALRDADSAIQAPSPAEDDDATRRLAEAINQLRQGSQEDSEPAAGLRYCDIARAASRTRDAIVHGAQTVIRRADAVHRELAALAVKAGSHMEPLLAQQGATPVVARMDLRLAQLAEQLDRVQAAQPDLLCVTMEPLASVVRSADTNPEDTESLTPPPSPRGLGSSLHAAALGTRSITLYDEEVPGPLAQGQAIFITPPAAGQFSITEVEQTYEPAVTPASPENHAEPVRISLPDSGDPLDQLVNIDFRDMELSHVVGLLAEKAGINVVAGVEVRGMVTARLTNVTLRQAMETALRLNDLGMIREGGVYRIVPYDEMLASEQVRHIVYLNEANAKELKETLSEIVVGLPHGELVSVSANETTNVLILSGPVDVVTELEEMVRALDVAEPVLPTVTEAIKLNYAEPKELVTALKESVLSEDGNVAADARGRYLIVTDVPAKIEQIRELITELDRPVKQVAIDAMIVDVLLKDTSQTGMDWFVDAVRRQSNRAQAEGSDRHVSNLQELNLTTSNPIPSLGTLTFDILSSEVNLKGLIAAQVAGQNAQLLANPVVVTVENKPATITISEEQPYEERTQSVTGPPMTSTEFKDIGTVLEVTPAVTHDDHILVDIKAKQSKASPTPTTSGIPIEIKREAETSLRTRNGQTIFIGGLREFSDDSSITKVPVLGNLPILNFMFRTTEIGQKCSELMIFVTCNVVPEEIPDLTPEQRAQFELLQQAPRIPESQKELGHKTLHPKRNQRPYWQNRSGNSNVR